MQGLLGHRCSGAWRLQLIKGRPPCLQAKAAAKDKTARAAQAEHEARAVTDQVQQLQLEGRTEVSSSASVCTAYALMLQPLQAH